MAGERTPPSHPKPFCPLKGQLDPAPIEAPLSDEIIIIDFEIKYSSLSFLKILPTDSSRLLTIPWRDKKDKSIELLENNNTSLYLQKKLISYK